MSRKRRRELRSEMRRILERLDPRWLKAASHELCSNLTELVDNRLTAKGGVDVQHVLAWISFFPGEADLASFISSQLGRRTVYLPRVLADNTMRFIAVGKDWRSAIEFGHFGIPEPVLSSGATYNPRFAPETIVVVPGLAFDLEGNRLGRGKGYYDRFLGKPDMRGAIKVGAGWSLQVTNDVPTESHDAIMDWVCDERTIARAGDHLRKALETVK